MGWTIDWFFCICVAIVCTFFTFFLFNVPLTSLKGVFLLGCIAGLILNYLVNKTNIGSTALPMFFSFAFVMGIGYFVLFPMILNTHTNEGTIPSSTISTPNGYSSEKSTQITTATPVEYYTRNYHWTYDRQSFTYTISIPKPLYVYYRNQPHDRNYAKYALSRNDRKVLDRIITSFEEKADSKTEAAYNVVAFVQSLPYFKDDVSTGYDDYARYPIETLIDNGGDCEDTAILTAALLKEMNYNVVLINPPGHMAVGITCSDCSGTSYTHDGKKYYYLETTGRNWKVGQIPDEYKNTKATIYSL
jgi:hypothetical protein